MKNHCLITNWLCIIEGPWKEYNADIMVDFKLFPFGKQFTKESIDSFLKEKISIKIKVPHFFTHLYEQIQLWAARSKNHLQSVTRYWKVFKKIGQDNVFLIRLMQLFISHLGRQGRAVTK